MASRYVELRMKSAFSFLRGASLPEDLVARGAALGYRALALADVDGLYGAPRFHKAARAAGLRALVGADVAVLETPMARPYRVLLLARDRAGYRNLSRLLTVARLGSSKLDARDHGAPVSWDELAAHAGGLVCLTGGAGGALEEVVMAPRVWRARAGALRELYGEHLYAEVQCHHDAAEARRAAATVGLARALRLPLLASNDVRYHEPARAALFDVLTCLQERTTLDAAGTLLERNRERHLKSPAEMAALFAALPEAIDNTARVAAACGFTLADLGYRFPHYPTPFDCSQQDVLARLTEQGARARYGERPSPRVHAQLQRELALIGKLELAGYFLIVWDLTRYCREQGILVQGRGSAANSAVCYALGITAVDPIGLDLLFERFLSEERGEWPDIDLDLPSGDDRERVIQYVYARYGARGAAMTANVITYRGRSAARDVGKALGFSSEQTGQLAGLMSHFEFRSKTDDDVPRLLASAGFDCGDRRVQLFGRLVGEIQGLPRHLGQHSGGMVLAAGRLDDVVPLEPASMPGRVVVQWDKDDCSDMGIIKVDLLGLGMMALLAEAVPLVRAHDGKAIDLAHLCQPGSPEDGAVYDMLCAADTVGVFQVESRAQMATLPRMKPRNFYDIAMEVAIIRPGPIVGQMVNPFLERRAGRQPVTYLHPDLEPILKRTLGVPLFQEQLMRMAMVIAGFTGGQAEELRRAMGFKRSHERMQGLEAALRSGMAERGITGAPADAIVKSIHSFALYGFPESHSLSFALLVYASAYLKRHHPVVFNCALLNNYPMGFYHPATIVKDAQRHGVRVRAVDVTRSDWRCTIEDGEGTRGVPEGDPRRNALRLGLRYVNGMREAVATRLMAARRERPFASLGDVARRSGASAAELETLAEIGAFAELGARRREALWQLQALWPLRDGLFAAAGAEAEREAAPAPLPEMDALERTLADYRGTSMTVGPHPMRLRRDELARLGVLPAAGLSQRRNGELVRIGGVVIVRQRPGTAKGVVFVTLEDETGISNAIVMPEVFERDRRVIVTSAVLIVEGVLQVRDGTHLVRAQRFQAVPALGAEAGSRDFH
ncbi:MAG: error-prone DNA polymerase [Deltaproteobacteria bacterium]|nr:error-prone DNA polymerase [Deltaproteobacteria bacterium]